jgi:hypothetical protein
MFATSTSVRRDEDHIDPERTGPHATTGPSQQQAVEPCEPVVHDYVADRQVHDTREPPSHLMSLSQGRDRVPSTDHEEVYA